MRLQNVLQYWVEYVTKPHSQSCSIMLAIQSIVLEGGILSGHTTFNHDPKLQHGSSTIVGIEEPFKFNHI